MLSTNEMLAEIERNPEVYRLPQRLEVSIVLSTKTFVLLRDKVRRELGLEEHPTKFQIADWISELVLEDVRSEAR